MLRAAISLLAAAVLGGCGLLDSPPPREPSILTIVGSFERQAHLQLSDDSGLLTAVAPEAPEDLLGRVQGIELAEVPGRPQSLYLAWVATPCEREFLLRLPASGGELDIVVLDARLTRGCEDLRIAYGVRLDFAVPVSALDMNAFMRR